MKRILGTFCLIVMLSLAFAAPQAVAAKGRRIAEPIRGAIHGPGTYALQSKTVTDDRGEAVLIVGTVTVDSPRTRGLSSCSWVSGSVEAKATWGGTLWTYTNRVDWCWDGQRVTTISPIQITADIPDWSVVLGWSYEGVKSSSQWDYFGDKWVYRSLTQGLFKYCPPRVICVQEVLPLIALDTYGDGTYQFQWRT